MTGERCSNHRPRYCVLHVIYAKGIVEPERAWLLRIPGCESSWDPLEIYPATHAGTRVLREEAMAGDVSSGLYQFKPSTWATTPEGAGHMDRIWSAYWQAFAAAYVYARDGGGSEWVCR